MLKTNSTIKKLLLVVSLSLVLTSCGEDEPETNVPASIITNLDVDALSESLKEALFRAGKEGLGALFFLNGESIDTLWSLLDFISTDSSDDEADSESTFSITSLLFNGISYDISDLLPDVPDLGIEDFLSEIDLGAGDSNLTVSILEDIGDGLTTLKDVTLEGVNSDYLSSLLK